MFGIFICKTATRQAVFFTAHIAGRIVDGVADISVFQIIHDLLNCHLRAVVLRLFRGSAQMRDHNGIVHVHGLRICKVGHIFFYLAGL